MPCLSEQFVHFCLDGSGIISFLFQGIGACRSVPPFPGDNFARDLLDCLCPGFNGKSLAVEFDRDESSLKRTACNLRPDVAVLVRFERCELHGLSVEREAIYGGQANREKNDYIIEAQREKIAELEKLNSQLIADNEAQRRLLVQAQAEWTEKTEQLADADAALDAIADAAYNEAIKTVALEAINETQQEQLKLLDDQGAKVWSPETRLREKERRLIHDWLLDTADLLKKRAHSILEKVIKKLRNPTIRNSVKERFKTQAKPVVERILEEYHQKSNRKKHRSQEAER